MIAMCGKTRTAVMVDVVDIAAALRIGAHIGVHKWVAVTITHRHWDHAGGLSDVPKHAELAGVPCVTGVDEVVPGITASLADGELLSWPGSPVRMTCLAAPFHTPGHVVYHAVHSDPPASEPLPTEASAPELAALSTPAGDSYFQVDSTALHPGAGVVFTGDTLFVAGSGRINGAGTAQQFHHALCDVIATLPPTTVVCVGHEYTLANLKFAAWAEPSNAAVRAKTEWAQTRRDAGLPTVPSTIYEELQYNPFLRPAAVKPVLQGAGLVGESANDVSVLAQLRQAKNDFGLGSSAGRT